MLKVKIFQFLAAAVAIAAFNHCGTAFSETLSTKDSADFDYCYEDVVPHNVTLYDFDNNGYADFTLSGSATYFAFSDGVTRLSTTQAATCQLMSDAASSTSFWNSINGSNQLYASGYTIEARVKVTEVAGTVGTHCFTVSTNSQDGANLILTTGGTIWGESIGDTDHTVLDSNSNSDDFHVFRIVGLANGAGYYLYRDGTLLKYNGSALLSNTGSTEGWDFNRFGYGDISGSGSTLGGTVYYDYIRIAAGAYAPVPEPSTFAMLAAGLVGLLAYAWRKRK